MDAGPSRRRDETAHTTFAGIDIPTGRMSYRWYLSSYLAHCVTRH